MLHQLSAIVHYRWPTSKVFILYFSQPGMLAGIRLSGSSFVMCPIKREDPEDFGVAFYCAVVDNGQPKTLFLWGQYLDELEYEKTFPNTAFEFTRYVASDEFLAFKTLGHYFKEEKTLPAFDKSVWKNGSYPVNGQLLNQHFDEIG